MKYYAVIDTNVIVSSMLCKTSYPGHILELIKNNTITPLYCSEIIDEYQDVLIRNKFGFDEKEVHDLIKTIVKNGKDYERTETNEKFVDEDDVVFYEVVMTGNKERSCCPVPSIVMYNNCTNTIIRISSYSQPAFTIFSLTTMHHFTTFCYKV